MKPRAHSRMDRAKRPNDPAANQAEDGEGTEANRLCLIGLKVDATLRSEIDAYAEVHGISRSRAANHYLTIARETIREREGIPSGRADEVLEAVDGLRAAVDILGPPTFGLLRLLAHWASQTGGLKVNEDELLAELRTVGADEWEQAIVEAERDLQEMTGGTEKSGRR
jgi:hypothetical protein